MSFRYPGLRPTVQSGWISWNKLAPSRRSGKSAALSLRQPSKTSVRKGNIRSSANRHSKPRFSLDSAEYSFAVRSFDLRSDNEPNGRSKSRSAISRNHLAARPCSAIKIQLKHTFESYAQWMQSWAQSRQTRRAPKRMSIGTETPDLHCN